MEVILLGTAAAEAWPASFCKCRCCVEARRRKGRDIRTRSGAIIDQVVKVDFGPDTVMQMIQTGRELTGLSTLLFTHAHDDHFSPAELQYRRDGFVSSAALELLHIYGNEEITSTLKQEFSDPSAYKCVIHDPIEPFTEFTTADKSVVMPFPANHAPNALLLRITRGDKSIFYGHDTGTVPEETIQGLAGVPLSLVLLDCTFGGAPNSGQGHMGVGGVLDTLPRLIDVGAIVDDTRIVATHFSHNGGLLYDELTAEFSGTNVQVSYDGMILDL